VIRFIGILLIFAINYYSL